VHHGSTVCSSHCYLLGFLHCFLSLLRFIALNLGASFCMLEYVKTSLDRMLLYSGCLLVFACLTSVSYTSTFSFHEFGGGRMCLGFSYGPRLLVKHVQRGLSVTVYMQINHAKIRSLLGDSGQ
jgi:hypothetical protein